MNNESQIIETRGRKRKYDFHKMEVGEKKLVTASRYNVHSFAKNFNLGKNRREWIGFVTNQRTKGLLIERVY